VYTSHTPIINVRLHNPLHAQLQSMPPAPRAPPSPHAASNVPLFKQQLLVATRRYLLFQASFVSKVDVGIALALARVFVRVQTDLGGGGGGQVYNTAGGREGDTTKLSGRFVPWGGV